MKKVLIICYYWPPAGGPGSQRMVKFVKYLSKLGWQPVVLTVKNGEFPYSDFSLEEEVPAHVKIYRTGSWEPFLFYKKLTGRQSAETLPVGLLTIEKHKLKDKLAAWIRTNIFIPDARVGWLPFAVRQGLEIIKHEKIDLIFTSSPPHSLQLAGFFLKKMSGVPWVADLRDPWTTIRYYQSMNRVCWARQLDTLFERHVLQTADQITTVSSALSQAFQLKISPFDAGKFHVLPNGYDEDDFRNVLIEQSDLFTIIHTGNMLAHQNPNVLWKSLQQLFHDQPKLKSHFKIRFIGRIHGDILNSIQKHGLEEIVEFQSFIPHQAVVKEIKNASMLLMVVPEIKNNEGIVTSKIFEYIGSGRPMLVIGPPHGDAGKIISQFSQSIICDYDDIKRCCTFIQKMFILWQNGRLPESMLPLRRSYSRKLLTKNLIEIFNNVLNKS